MISKRRTGTDSLPVPGPFRPAEIGRSLEGQRLGHFELQQCIGGGGMGVVFRGLDTTLGRTVAVKVVANDTTDEETLRRFRNEAQSAARLDHPNIARVYYVGEDGGWNYIVFEYIDGVNIRDRVQERGPLPVEEAISYTLQIAEALGHAAHRDVVHRDIKPSNILVMADGRAKLVDMGLARLHQVGSEANDLTATGVTLGTFDYISPEQARDPRMADVRSDLYSLGCTFYYMLTGLPPFPEGTVLQKLLSHSSEPPRDPRDIRGDLTEEVAGIALRLMAKQPSQRFQRPEELVAALVMAADRIGLSLIGYTTSIVVSSSRSGWAAFEYHLPWLVPSLLLLLAVFGLEWLPTPDALTHADMRPRLATSASNRAESPKPEQRAAQPKKEKTVSPGANRANVVGDAKPAAGGGRADQKTPVKSSPAAAPSKPSAQKANVSEPSSSDEQPPKPSVDPSTTGKASGGEPARTQREAVNPDVPSASTNVAPPGHANVLVVRPDAAVDEKSNIVDSLESAFRRLVASPDVSVIELHFDERDETPRTVPLPPDGHEVTIRAGEGYVPVIVFRPDSTSVGSERRMLNLISGSIAFENVHFRVELPHDLSDGWSLFHLNHVERVRLHNCSLTIRNPFLSKAAFFDVLGPRDSTIDYPTIDYPPVTSSTTTTPKLILDSCVVRGQATLVRAIDGLPFGLSWKQGFLVTTEAMAEVGGLSASAMDDVVRITLANVTSSVGAGMLKLELRESGPKLPEVGLDCTNCVFVHPREVPLADYRGIGDLERAATLFEMVGKDNFYDFTEVRWRLSGVRGENREFRWEDQDEPWYREKRAERGLRWRAPLPIEGDPSQRTPNEYLLDANESPPAGFDLEMLPSLPDRLPHSAAVIGPSAARR